MEPYRAFIADTLLNLLNSHRISSPKFLHWFSKLCKCFLVSFPLVLLVQREITNLGFLPPFSWCCLFHWICLGSSILLKKIPPTEEELKDKEDQGLYAIYLDIFLCN
jgi:hypothetical protein